MFQRFLQNEERQREVQILKDLQANMQTLNQLVTYLTKEKQNSDQAVREILQSNHPAFAQLRKMLSVSYRVYFTNRAELSEWLRARRFTPIEEVHWDGPEYEEWMLDQHGSEAKLLKVSKKLFDQAGNINIYTAQQWDRNWITLEDYVPAVELEPIPVPEITDDDIPF
jgi:hypothetical protein